MILALDTAAEFGSLALFAEGRLLEEVPLHAPEGFSSILFPRIEALLARHDVTFGAIHCFAAVSGPGAFTGLRVGLAAVKGLAEAAGARVVAVSRLRAVASFGTRPFRAPVLDARRGQIFGAVYDAALELRSPEVVEAFPAWLSALPEGEIEFVAQDFGPYVGALAGTPFAAAKVTAAPRSLAGAPPNDAPIAPCAAP